MLRGQSRTDQGFHLSPNLGITLNFSVRLHEDTVVPGILLAVDRMCFVLEVEISDDVRACRISGADLGLLIAAAVVLAGCVLALVTLPARPRADAEGPR